MNTAIFIENNKLDLFEDEEIEIVSSVLDVQDITKNTTEYSKTFTVPASQRNNEIFKHYYNADIDNTFDARKNKAARIELSNVVFRTGRISLQKVQVKKNQPYAYTLNFYGELLSFKNLFGEDKLKDLSFDRFIFDYTYANMLALLNGTSSLCPELILAAFAHRQWYYNSNSTDTTNSETETNIAYNTASGTNGIRIMDMKPSIKLSAIIDAIESKYGVIFSDDFINTNQFDELYLYLDNGDSTVGESIEIVDFDGGSSDYMNLTTNIGTYPISVSTESWYLEIDVVPETGYEDNEYTINNYLNGKIVSTRTGSGALSLFTNIIISDGNSNEFYSEIVSKYEFSFHTTLVQTFREGHIFTDYTTTSSTQTITPEVLIENIVPDIKIIDFLKGIFQSFKAVIIPQEDGTVYLDTVSGYYSKGQLVDLTDFLDYGSIDVNRPDFFNVINYKFQDPSTLLNQEFEDVTGEAYGDEYLEVTDESGNLLDGTTSSVELPFEQLVYERLFDIETNEQTDFVYGGVFDKEIKSVKIKPHIHYSRLRYIGAYPLSLVDETDAKHNFNASCYTPSHSISDTDSSDAFIFGEEIDEFNNQLLTNNLYTNYHQRYIDALFNTKRRDYKLSIKNIPQYILNNLELNDIIKIRNNYYRINAFTTKLHSRSIEFDIYNLQELDIYLFSSPNTYISVNYEAQSFTAYVTNLTTYTYNKVDTGDGTGWITVSDSGGNLIFTFTENGLLQRDMIIEVTDDVTGTTITFTIYQLEHHLTADSTFGTADTTLITADYI